MPENEIPPVLRGGFYYYLVSTNVHQTYFAFLHERKICIGANNNDEKISSIDLLIIPLNKNTTDGVMESTNALKRLFLFQQIIHIMQ